MRSKMLVDFELWLARHSKREKIALCALPIVLSMAVAAFSILPFIDDIYAISRMRLSAQEELANTLANLDATSNQEQLINSLAQAQQQLQQLQELAIPSNKLIKKLEPFSRQIQHKHSRLFFIMQGDIDALEDMIELLESQHFLFIQGITIKADFASNIEMSFDVLNLGDSLFDDNSK